MSSRFRAKIGVLAFFLGLYGLTFHGYVDIEDTEVCYQSTRNLMEHGSLALGEGPVSEKIEREGFYVTRGPDGAYYPIYPLLQILLPVPFYEVGKAASEMANDKPEEVTRLGYASLNVVAGALLCLVVLALAMQLGFDLRTAVSTALIAGSCTMLWPYAQSTFPDTALTLFFGASVLCLCKASGGSARPRLGWLLAAGALHGLAALTRPVAYLLLVPSLVYLRGGGRRSAVLFLLPVVALTAAAVALDAMVFGRPLEASYLGAAAGEPPLLTYSYSLSLWGLLFSDGRGLFMLSPVLLLALFSFPALRARQPREAGMFAGHFALLALFFAAFAGWHGGWCWGARYLLPAVPLVAVGAAPWLMARGLWRRGLTALLVVVSLCIQVLAVAVPYRIYMTAISLHEADLTQFFLFTRFSPVVAQAKILLHKLAGKPDVYSTNWLFDLPGGREFDATLVPHPEISRYNEAFDSFAWVRVFEKGHTAVAVAGVAGCLALMVLGWVLLRRSTRSAASAPAPAGSS